MGVHASVCNDFLTSADQECRLVPHRMVLPKIGYAQCSRPGITGEDPLGPESGSQESGNVHP